jgi:hypothetical protein
MAVVKALRNRNAVPVFYVYTSRVFWNEYAGIKISTKSSGIGGGNPI